MTTLQHHQVVTLLMVNTLEVIQEVILVLDTLNLVVILHKVDTQHKGDTLKGDTHKVDIIHRPVDILHKVVILNRDTILNKVVLTIPNNKLVATDPSMAIGHTQEVRGTNKRSISFLVKIFT